MTARTRSSLRYASIFTIATLIAMALGFVMVRGAYEGARADAVASAAATPVASPPPTSVASPTFDDAVSAYRAGQWTALALASFAVLFIGLRKAAKARGSVWLGAFASYLAGAGAVLVTGVAYAIKVGGIDPAVMGAAISTLALTIYKLPADAPVETGIATSPRDTQAGYVAPHLNLVISIGLALLLLVPFAASCSSPAVRGTAGALRQEIVDCGRAEVKDLAADLMPAVTAIVTGDTPSWRAQLDALLHAGTQAGACAIRAVGGELAARAAAAVTGAHAEGQERVGAEHAREYLAARGFVFEVR